MLYSSNQVWQEVKSSSEDQNFHQTGLLTFYSLFSVQAVRCHGQCFIRGTMEILAYISSSIRRGTT